MIKKNITIFVFGLALAVILVSSTTDIQSPCDSPVVGGHTGAPGETGCNGCHAGIANSGSAIIDFDLGTTSYIPGKTYKGYVRIRQKAMEKFGFVCLALKNNDKTTIGKFSLLNTIRTRTYTDGDRNYVSHTPCGADSINANSWTFQWTAPSVNVDTITIYLGALAANHDHATTGDEGYQKKIILTPNNANGLNISKQKNISVYPNPFLDRITIDKIENENITSILVLDLLGKEVFYQKVNKINKSISIDFNKQPQLANGTYLLKITTEKNIYLKKISKY